MRLLITSICPKVFNRYTLELRRRLNHWTFYAMLKNISVTSFV
ncbi:hypothetical protein HanXRQr2_Chr07g0294591 [Helianthus annuus]|uniref:Uncharacterized protein n=1 Tax=Helianthus annuus TaxID=4232 RepID=A0A9K3IKF5_HELAN|nr:hypothetical protein HanXRQr2_Chr07g0294591 [Helianthus annuus]KAJ0904690.1 hypothetical protein HanPSC8_Chr07g0285191 [Helianthus annuus]